MSTHTELLDALKLAESALDFQLTNCQALANLMDDPAGLAVIYEVSDKLGADLRAIRQAIARATGRTIIRPDAQAFANVEAPSVSPTADR